MTSSFGWTEWLSMMGSFLIVIFLLVATLIVIRKVGPKMGMSGGKRLQILEVQQIGSRQKLVLVRVNEEQVLVGLSPQNMTQLGNFPHTDMGVAMAFPGEVENDLKPSEPHTQGGFKQILSRVLKK